MKCTVCNNEGTLQLKKGCICRKCYKKLPKYIKKNISYFNAEDIASLEEYRKVISDYRKIMDISEKVILYDTYLAFGDYNIPHSEIENIEFKFHPDYSDGANRVLGFFTMVLTLKNPAVRLEKVLDDAAILNYVIDKDKIFYGKHEIQETFEHFGFDCFIRSQYKSIFEYRRVKKEQYRKRHEQRERANGQQKQRKSNNTNMSELYKARLLFDVGEIYTKEEIKKIRNELLRTYHPDEGGTNKFTQEVNKSYTILLNEIS